METYTVVGDDSGVYLTVSHPDHKEYFSVVRIEKDTDEITLETPYMAFIDGKNVRWEA